MSAKSDSIVRSMVDAIRSADRAKTSPYDTQATVRRVENGVAWVHIPGGVDETPVKLTIAAEPGDEVQVRVSGGRAFLIGNASAPPTDDRTARTIGQTLTDEIKSTNSAVTIIRKAVEAVQKIAGNTNQYFWHTETGTDTGAHITEIPQEEFLADPENGGGNLLTRSNGIAVRDGLTELAQFSANGLDVYGADSGGNQIEIAHLGYGNVYNPDSVGTATGRYYTIGTRAPGNVGAESVSVGLNNISDGAYSIAIGYDNRTAGRASIAIGTGLTTGNNSFSLGKYNSSNHDFVVGIGTSSALRKDGLYMDASDGILHTASDIVPGSGQFQAISATLPADAVPSGTWSELGSLWLTEEGTYIIIFGGAFATNATGYRQLYLADSATVSPGRWSPSHRAVDGEQTRFSSTQIYTASGAPVDLTLYARQNSGSALSVYGYIQAIKIGA